MGPSSPIGRCLYHLRYHTATKRPTCSSTTCECLASARLMNLDGYINVGVLPPWLRRKISTLFKGSRSKWCEIFRLFFLYLYSNKQELLLFFEKFQGQPQPPRLHACLICELQWPTLYALNFDLGPNLIQNSHHFGASLDSSYFFLWLKVV